MKGTPHGREARTSPERSLVTGIGPLTVRQPRVHDKREGESFTSAILPRYMRRVPTIDKLLPVLYLKGISTGDFTAALESILGQNAPGLSATTIVRLKRIWETEYREWAQARSHRHTLRLLLGGRHLLQRPARRTENQPDVLPRRSWAHSRTGPRNSWPSSTGTGRASLLAGSSLNLKQRGLTEGPKLAIGDGGLGLLGSAAGSLSRHERAALLGAQDGQRAGQDAEEGAADGQEPHPGDVHVPDAGAGAGGLQRVPGALRGQVSRRPASALAKDKDVLFTFYDFPAEHWSHLRTTNPIEITFATVRHRSRQTKGCGSRAGHLDDGFQALQAGREDLEKDQGLSG